MASKQLRKCDVVNRITSKQHRMCDVVTGIRPINAEMGVHRWNNGVTSLCDTTTRRENFPNSASQHYVFCTAVQQHTHQVLIGFLFFLQVELWTLMRQVSHSTQIVQLSAVHYCSALNVDEVTTIVRSCYQ